MTLPKPNLSMEHEPAEGDVRGAFGYGRPAHGSDPHATYKFSPSEFPPLGPTEPVADVAPLIAMELGAGAGPRGDTEPTVHGFEHGQKTTTLDGDGAKGAASGKVKA